MVNMTVELYDRRKAMLDLHYSGVKSITLIKEIASQYEITYDTARMDWHRRSKWEPLIWRMENSKEDVERLLYHLRLGRERALILMRTANNDNAKVGAIGKLIELVTKEIELRQSLGALPRIADKLEVSQELTIQRKTINLEDYSDDEREALRSVARIMEKRNPIQGTTGAE